MLTPILLLTLGAILYFGFQNPPAALHVQQTAKEAFVQGATVGYNTLDLIASFIFAPLVLSHFTHRQEDDVGGNGSIKKMLKASIIAAVLLSGMYIGLTYIASYYTPLLPPHHPEERLAAISMYLLGPYGALISSVAVAMACLTTAIPLVSIASDYVDQDLLKGRGGKWLPSLIVLGMSAAIANLGFGGIASMLGPVLQILCPGLIVLCALNILYKLNGMEISRVPVYAAFGLSFLGWLYLA